MYGICYLFPILENCQGVIQYLGDGVCDDSHNYADCSYDLGDCCLENVITDFCTICECLEGNNIIKKKLYSIVYIPTT